MFFHRGAIAHASVQRKLTGAVLRVAIAVNIAGAKKNCVNRDKVMTLVTSAFNLLTVANLPYQLS